MAYTTGCCSLKATLIAKHLGTRNTRLLKRRKLNREHVREKTSRNKKHQAAKRRKFNQEHVRESEQYHFRKWKAENWQPIRHQKEKTKGYGSGKCVALTCSSHELQPQENKYGGISMKNLFLVLLHLQLYRTLQLHVALSVSIWNGLYHWIL